MRLPATFKLLTFPVLGSALAIVENSVTLMISYEFCLLSAYFCNTVFLVGDFESHVQFSGRCAPWRVANREENRIL